MVEVVIFMTVVVGIVSFIAIVAAAVMEFLRL
jgi:hypothetical protein